MELFEWNVSDRVLLVPAIVAVVGLVVSIRSIFGQVSVTYVYMGLYLLFGLGGLALYYAVQNTSPTVLRGPFRFAFNTQVGRRLLSALFFLLFAGAVLALEFRSPGAVRPDSYYVLSSLAIGVLFVRAVASTGSRRDVVWVLAQIVLLGFLVRFALVYLNPYPYISDAAFHWTLVKRTIETGQFGGSLWFGAPYQFYPVYHLLDVATFLFASGTDSPVWLYPVFNSAVIVLTLPLVFLLGRHLSGDLTGLLAALLILTTNFYFLQPHYTTNWVAITFMLLSVLALLELFGNENRPFSMWLLFWLFALSSLLVHPVNFVVLVTFLVGMFLVASLVRWTDGTRNGVPLASAGLLFLSYIFSTHRSVFDELVMALLGLTEEQTASKLTHTSNVVDIPVVSPFTAELTLNYVSVTALVLFAVPAALYLLRRRNMNHNSFALGTGVIFLFTILVYLSGLGGSFEVVRVINYIAPFTAVLAGFGLALLVGTDVFDDVLGYEVTTTHVVALLFIIVVVVASISMLSYTSGNFNGTLSQEVNHYRLTADPSTLSAHAFMEMTPPETTVTGDYTTLMYIAAYDPIGGATEPVRSMHTLEQYDNSSEMRVYFGANWTESRYYIVNEPAIEIRNSYAGIDYNEIYLQTGRAKSKVYATKRLEIYYDPLLDEGR